MMQFFKRLFKKNKNISHATEINTGNSTNECLNPKEQAVTKDINNPIPPIQNTGLVTNNTTHIDGEIDLHNLIWKLDYIHRDAEQQVLKRIEAYQEMGKLGGKAVIAIPILIRKIFSGSSKEETAAQETLGKIDNNWLKTTFAEQEIPFLIDKLKKDQIIANKASRLLLEIGDSAMAALVKKLGEEDFDNPYFEANIIKTVAEYDNNVFVRDTIPILKDILRKKENPHLLEMTAYAIVKAAYIDDEVIFLVINLLNKTRVNSLKIKLVDLLQKLVENEKSDIIVFPLLKYLADDNEIVRNKCIQIFSNRNNDVLDRLFRTIIEGEGKLSDDDILKIFDKVGLWVNPDIALYQYSGEKFFNNISWYNLELQKDIERPFLLLNAVLEVYNAKGRNSETLIESFKKICQGAVKTKTTLLCIKILSNYAGHQKDIVPFLINYINHESKDVREACIASLFKLDPQWLENQENQKRIDALIDAFSENDNELSIQALIQIGADATPLLLNKLAKTENRIRQENIIKVLDSFGDNLVTSIPALVQLQNELKNAHTVNALKRLIEKLSKSNI